MPEPHPELRRRLGGIKSRLTAAANSKLLELSARQMANLGPEGIGGMLPLVELHEDLRRAQKGGELVKKRFILDALDYLTTSKQESEKEISKLLGKLIGEGVGKGVVLAPAGNELKPSFNEEAAAAEIQGGMEKELGRILRGMEKAGAEWKKEKPEEILVELPGQQRSQPLVEIRGIAPPRYAWLPHEIKELLTPGLLADQKLVQKLDEAASVMLSQPPYFNAIADHVSAHVDGHAMLHAAIMERLKNEGR